jgi:hypothetical protein
MRRSRGTQSRTKTGTSNRSCPTLPTHGNTRKDRTTEPFDVTAQAAQNSSTLLGTGRRCFHLYRTRFFGSALRDIKRQLRDLRNITKSKRRQKNETVLQSYIKRSRRVTRFASHRRVSQGEFEQKSGTLPISQSMVDQHYLPRELAPKRWPKQISAAAKRTPF